MANTGQAVIQAFPCEDDMALADLVEKGIPVETLRGLSSILHLTPVAFAATLGIPRRTAARRLTGNEKLSPNESERALRIVRLLHIAEELFVDGQAASDWFKRPLSALDGKSPLEMCRTEPGARAVEQLLGRIEHGVFG